MKFIKESLLPKSNLWLVIYILFYAFILTLNMLQMPLMDEWIRWPGRPVEGFGLEYAISPYFNWNSRFGELVFLFFEWNFGQTIFEQQFIFGIINTLVFCSFFNILFYLVKGSFPKANKEDALLFSFLAGGLFTISHFSESFIWMPGAFNYGWAVIFAACWALPYRIYWQKNPAPAQESYSFNSSTYFSPKEIAKALSFFILSIPVGMGGEVFGPGLCLALFFFFLYTVFIQKRIPPLWFLAGGAGLFAGWILMITAPGPAKRKAGIMTYSPESFLLTPLTVFQRFIERVSSPYAVGVLSFLGLHTLWAMFRQKKIPWLILAITACSILNVLVSTFIASIPGRTFIELTIFFLIAAALIFVDFLKQKTEASASWLPYSAALLGLLSLKYSLYEPHIRTILTIAFIVFFIWTALKAFPFFPYLIKQLIFPFLTLSMIYYIISYAYCHITLKKVFAEIEYQRSIGTQNIIVPVESSFWWERENQLWAMRETGWTLEPMARYYKVKSIRLVEPRTMKAYYNPKA